MASKNTSQRFREIVRVLGFYGFGFLIDNKIKKTPKNSAKNLRKAFEELGPTFIKIGQILSTRPDILPQDYTDELQSLQDNAPFVEYYEIEAAFYNEFKSKIEDSFLDFEEIPLASASIAQVHRAKLKSGEDVIVKIKRPNIERNLELDIAILKKLAALTKARFEDALIDPGAALNEILLSTRNELDFSQEASAMEKFSELNKEVNFISCPRIFRELTSRNILTMEYIDGIKITDTTALESKGYDMNDIGRKLALSYFKQVFEDGYFHGDPHPGNILVKNKKIYFIDFGIMGSLSIPMRDVLNDIVISIAYRDIDKTISSLLAIGIKKGYVNRARLYEDIDYLFENYLSISLENIHISELLEDIFDVAKKNNIRLPKDLTLLIRGIVIIEGVVAKIAPDIKILDIAIPYVKSTNKSKLLPDFEDFMFNAYNTVKDTAALPSKAIRLINSINNGRVKLQLEHRNLSKHINELNKMVNRVVFSLIVSSLIIGSSLILNTSVGPKIFGISIIGITGFIIAAFLGLWLLISILKSGKL